MEQNDRARLFGWFTLYSALGLVWAGFAAWVVPPRLAAEPPGPAIEALRRFLHVTPVPFLNQDLLGRWREFWVSVLIAMALHLTIVAVLGRYDRMAARGGAGPEARASRRVGLVLGTIALAFLAVAILAPMRQDYFFYLEMWHHVLKGDDPWFMVWGVNGHAPLNAYGPLFNLLAGLSWINPRAPRLFFSYAYLLFAIGLSRDFEAGRPPSVLRAIGLLVLFWNPFPWVEVAFYGHFDILVALACIGAVGAWGRGWDIRAGLALAAGVLLKYLPIAVLPFLALDRDRPRLRTRILATTLAAIAVGLASSWLVWGSSTFSPLHLAATRSPTALSIFRYIRGPYSPLPRLGITGRYEELSMPAQLLALCAVWRWSRARKPHIEATAFAAVLVLVLLYRVGYPQYQMVPFAMGAAWLLGQWDRLRYRAVPVAAMTLYFGWIAYFDVFYMLDEAWGIGRYSIGLEASAGLPTFLLGFALVGCIALAAMPEESDAAA